MTIPGSIGTTLGGIVSASPIGGLVSGVAGSAAGLVLNGISTWVLDGTRGALEEVAKAISAATAPNLDSTWFSSTYWRVAALATLLTIPFLCAAAVQALARSDLALLARVAFGYLPLSLLSVSLAAPLTMLLLAATDQMSAVVSASAATGGASFLDHAAATAGALASATGGSPFFAVVVGLLAVMAALALAVELLVRAAAVYIVVLMLPLAFAAMVWPARRIWAVRLVELLSSLVLSKFVIVAVLSLAGAAFADGTPGIGELLVAMSLILLSTFAPWALMRILPFTELAAGAAGMMRQELPAAHARAASSAANLSGAGELAMDLPARLRDQAATMHARGGGESWQSTPSSPPSEAYPSAWGPASADASSEPEPPAFSMDSAHADPSAGGTPAVASTGSTPAGPSAGGTPAGPSTGSTSAGASSGSAVSSPSTPDQAPGDGLPPFVPPPAWRGSTPVRLDSGLLQPAEPTLPPAADPHPSEPPGPGGADGRQ